METRGIAVFDVCGTITKTNNTSDFIGFVLRRSGILRYLRFVFLRILCLLPRLPGLRRLVSTSSLRKRQIALLRGYSPACLREQARSYAESLFAQGLGNDRILASLRQETEQGRKVVLASAAIDPPIAAIAERLDVRDFVSSELEIENGRCTGRLRLDLLGSKRIALERIVAKADLGDSVAYSDNPEDAEFMKSFSRRYMVLNTSAAESRWNVSRGEFDRFVNYGEARSERDVDSVNTRTRKWIYVPLLYYGFSRFHRTGLFSLLFREVVPATLAAWLFTNLGAVSFLVMPLSILMFYCVYEMGGLMNDLLARREAPGRRTRRIAPEVRVDVRLFFAVRIAAVSLILTCLPLGVPLLSIYVGILPLCLGIYLLHSLVGGHWRIPTFILLKLCRNCVPLVILAAYASSGIAIWLCSIFFLIDAPWRVHAYCRQVGLIRTEIPATRVRRANILVLWGLGVLVYVAAGLPHLWVLASYHLALECLGVVRVVSPVRPASRGSRVVQRI